MSITTSKCGFLSLSTSVLNNFLPFLTEIEQKNFARCNSILNSVQTQWVNNNNKRRLKEWEKVFNSIGKTVPAKWTQICHLKTSKNSVNFTSHYDVVSLVLDIKTLAISKLEQTEDNECIYGGLDDDEVSVFTTDGCVTGQSVVLDNNSGSILHEINFPFKEIFPNRFIKVFGTEKKNQILEFITHRGQLILFDPNKISKETTNLVGSDADAHKEFNLFSLLPKTFPNEGDRKEFGDKNKFRNVYKVGKSYYCHWAGNSLFPLITFIKDINSTTEQTILVNKFTLCECDRHFFYVSFQNVVTIYKEGCSWKTFRVGNVESVTLALFPSDYGLVVRKILIKGRECETIRVQKLQEVDDDDEDENENENWNDPFKYNEITIWNHTKYEPKNENIRPLFMTKSIIYKPTFVKRDLLIYKTNVWKVYDICNKKEIPFILHERDILNVVTICNPMPKCFVAITFPEDATRTSRINQMFNVFSLDETAKES